MNCAVWWVRHLVRGKGKGQVFAAPTHCSLASSSCLFLASVSGKKPYAKGGLAPFRSGSCSGLGLGFGVYARGSARLSVLATPQ